MHKTLFSTQSKTAIYREINIFVQYNKKMVFTPETRTAVGEFWQADEQDLTRLFLSLEKEDT